MNELGALTPHEFAHLGDGSIAYLKTIKSEDAQRLFPQAPADPARPAAVCAARGRWLADHADRLQGRCDRQRLGAGAGDRERRTKSSLGRPATAGRRLRPLPARAESARLGLSAGLPCALISIYCRDALENGAVKGDRTGTGVRSLFGRQIRFDLSQGFPLVTTKRLHIKSIVHELIWFLNGDTNIAYLKANGVSIWDEWADAEGDLGPVYGTAMARLARARTARIHRPDRLADRRNQAQSRIRAA